MANKKSRLTKRIIDALQKKVLAFYAREGRDLPWRRTRDPYAVLVSEVMLQQTQVVRVVPKYAAFLKKFPTIADLARARTHTLLSLWSGLGYNTRALRLRELAKLVVRERGGELPKDESDLAKLPGMGPYTRRAVQIFAWNTDTACIDTNIRRILIHELGLAPDVALRELEAIALACVPTGQSRLWHNALMDYGALVLTSKRSAVRPVARSKPFQNSRRYYRGQIVKLLVREKKMPDRAVVAAFQNPYHDVVTIIRELIAERFIRRRGGWLQI